MVKLGVKIFLEVNVRDNFHHRPFELGINIAQMFLVDRQICKIVCGHMDYITLPTQLSRKPSNTVHYLVCQVGPPVPFTVHYVRAVTPLFLYFGQLLPIAGNQEKHMVMLSQSGHK